MTALGLRRSKTSGEEQTPRPSTRFLRAFWHRAYDENITGLAGMVEVAAVQGRANANLAVGYGFTGILVAFLARHNPLAIIPVAILLGGIGASGGLLQRRLGLPDASVLVLQGIIFVTVLASETLYGRLRLFGRKTG